MLVGEINMGNIETVLKQRKPAVKPDTLHILAIEDNPADFRILNEYLKENPSVDFEIAHAETLKEALELLRSVQYSVVLLDLNLPDSKGLEGIEKLGAVKSLPPIIVLTGMDSEETGLQALAKNAQDFLVKGKINSDVLIRSIRYAIERNKAEESLRRINEELEKRTEELLTANENLDASRAAALNLMEDAVRARRMAEQMSADLAHATDQLRRSEETFRQIAENSQDIYWLTSADGKDLLYLSPAYESICQQPVAEAYKRPSFWLDCACEDDSVRLAETFRTHLNASLNEEFRIKRPDGSFRWIWARTFPILDESHNLQRMLGVARDITERKLFEEKLIIVQKLESIGVLAGGIAHDFNNLLTAILGNISLAKFVLPPESQATEYLNGSEKACEMAKDLSSRLLTFSKGGAPVKSIMRVDALVRESVSFMLSGSNVLARFALDEGLAPVEIDANQIRQVIQNLVINAREAMPAGGTLTASASNVKIKNKNPMDLAPGQFVKISLEDQGKGIPPDDIPKIFDPYYTTSELGSRKGRGLGLAICHSIIQKHRGGISVESTVGRGTVFSIYLPAANQATREPEPR